MMTNRKYNYSILGLITISILILFVSCSRDMEDLGLASYPTTAEVFIDGFSAGLEYDAFGTSKVTAFSVDNKEKYKGTASMRFDIPATGDPLGGFAAGIFTTEDGRDLSGYTALTFWGKASRTATISEMGFGFTFEEEKYRASVNDLAFSTNWEKFVIPIPDASKLNPEKGLFYYVDDPDNGQGYTFWVDEVKYENLATIAYKEPFIFDGEDKVETAINGSTFPIVGVGVSLNLPNGIEEKVNATAAYFTFTSSNTNVATVNENGIVSVLSEGTAIITASLGEAEAKGSLTINSTGAFVHAPTPTHDPDYVISIFSDAYTNVPVAYYNGYWQPYQTTESADFVIDGDAILNYTNFNFVGIEIASPLVDASNMTHLHLDIWIPNDVNPSDMLGIEIVDNGPDGTGATQSKFTTVFSSPDPLVSQSWVSLDISLAGLTTKSNIFQLIFKNQDSALSGFYADNIYLYNDGGGTGITEPTTPAPDPIQDAADVISIYSDAYTPITVSEFPTPWSFSDFEEIQIAGNNTIRYGNFDVTGIVTDYNNPTDLTGMTHVHFDYWTPDGTELGIKLVNTVLGEEDQVSLSAVTQGEWVSVDILLDDFAIDRSQVTQILLDNEIPDNASITVYMDNLYFYRDGGGMGGDEPTTPAPDPTQDAADVISIYSDAYTPITVSEFPTPWSFSDFEVIQIAGNNTIKYGNFDVTGIVTDYNNPTDLTGMTHVHFDYWTPDGTELGIKLVNTVLGEEDQVSLSAVTQGEWVSVDILLDDFAIDRSQVTQILLDNEIPGDASITVYMDNLYFYRDGGGMGGDEPTTPAPDPIQDAADVISIYSDAYTPITVSEFPTSWSFSDFEMIQIAGNNTIKYGNFDVIGIVTDYNNPTDLTGMTHVHFDYWTPDGTELGIKLVNTVLGEEDQVSLSAVTQGEWVSVDILLDDFAIDRSQVTQILLDNEIPGDASITVYMDNLYFYKSGGGGGNYTLNDPIGFEPNGFGSGWTWNVFENGSNPPLEFVSNPDASGINTSATVAKITALQSGQPWVGCETAHGEMGITWDLSPSNAFIKIMVYKTVISDVGIKLVNPAGGAQEEIKVSNTKINEWEELTFDFSDRIGNGLDGSTNIDQIVVFPDFDLGGRTSDNVVYFDNIRFTSN